MEANDPRDVASLGPSGLIGRIYVVDHYTLLHTTYISSGPSGAILVIFVEGHWWNTSVQIF